MPIEPFDYQKRRANYLISSNPDLLDFQLIHSFLSQQTSWRKDTSFETLVKDLSDSLCFGLYFEQQQIGFASVTTDFSSFAYLTDVFVLEKFRGKGLAQWLLETILAHPDLQQNIDWMLSSEEAQGLYEKVGFTKAGKGGEQMEKRNCRD